MFVIGSRGSKLALWQAEYTKSRLQALGHESRIEIITTTGDRFQTGPLKEVGNKGLFTKEIEDALLARQIDIAVHSLKDMPTLMPDGLVIAATPEREDARDAMVGRKLADVPTSGRIGTGSLRRIAQLYRARPDVTVEPIRGNVDTRLRKLDSGQFDAIVLAAAGLRRLGWAERISEYLSPDIMCPAVGQGSLAIQTRADGGPAFDAVTALDHADTRAAITAERAVLSILGGGCQVPVGAHATVNVDRIDMIAIVSAPDGKTVVHKSASGSITEAEGLGRALGEELLAAGAAEILSVVFGHAG